LRDVAAKLRVEPLQAPHEVGLAGGHCLIRTAASMIRRSAPPCGDSPNLSNCRSTDPVPLHRGRHRRRAPRPGRPSPPFALPASSVRSFVQRGGERFLQVEHGEIAGHGRQLFRHAGLVSRTLAQRGLGRRARRRLSPAPPGSLVRACGRAHANRAPNSCSVIRPAPSRRISSSRDDCTRTMSEDATRSCPDCRRRPPGRTQHVARPDPRVWRSSVAERMRRSP